MKILSIFGKIFRFRVEFNIFFQNPVVSGRFLPVFPFQVPPILPTAHASAQTELPVLSLWETPCNYVRRQQLRFTGAGAKKENGAGPGRESFSDRRRFACRFDTPF